MFTTMSMMTVQCVMSLSQPSGAGARDKSPTTARHNNTTRGNREWSSRRGGSKRVGEEAGSIGKHDSVTEVDTKVLKVPMYLSILTLRGRGRGRGSEAAPSTTAQQQDWRGTRGITSSNGHHEYFGTFMLFSVLSHCA